MGDQPFSTLALRTRLRFNLDAQFLPNVFLNGQEHRNYIRIELLARMSLDLAASGGDRLRSAIRAVRSHGVKRIGDGEYPRPQARETVTSKAAVICAL